MKAKEYDLAAQLEPLLENVDKLSWGLGSSLPSGAWVASDAATKNARILRENRIAATGEKPDAVKAAAHFNDSKTQSKFGKQGYSILSAQVDPGSGTLVVNYSSVRAEALQKEPLYRLAENELRGLHLSSHVSVEARPSASTAQENKKWKTNPEEYVRNLTQELSAKPLGYQVEGRRFWNPKSALDYLSTIRSDNNVKVSVVDLKSDKPVESFWAQGNDTRHVNRRFGIAIGSVIDASASGS